MSQLTELEPEEIKSRFKSFLEQQHDKAVQDFTEIYPERFLFTFDWESLQTCDPTLAQEYRTQPTSIQEDLDSALQFSDAHDAICLTNAWVAPSTPPFEVNLHNLKAKDIGNLIGSPIRVGDITDQRKKVRTGGYRCSACENLETVFFPTGEAYEPFQCSECNRKRVDFSLEDEFTHFVPHTSGTLEDAAHLLYDYEEPTTIDADFIGPIADRIQEGDWLIGVGVLSADIDQGNVVTERLQVFTGDTITAEDMEGRIHVDESHPMAPDTDVTHLSAFNTTDVTLKREHLIGFMNHVQTLFNEYGSEEEMTEEDVKIKVINPLLEILGWDIFGPEVRLEYPVPLYKSQKSVDYALLVDDHPTVCIEAKNPAKAIGRKSLEQLYEYMRELDSELGILTNGWKYQLIRRGTTRVPNQVADFTVELMPEYAEEVENYTFENVGEA